ncbi:MAG TPA: PLP-dependent aminotransferase family protein [Bryobacteraceae bacterium]|jgi:GntR family transcriptional regulator/MocR family aminotransferase|nr:PLP-dependent aminotransferase family protein [Bryobacteraceae bacterium]
MKKVRGGFPVVIAVDRKAAKPLHRQIYDAFRASIVARSLNAGQQIPSSRALAAELGVSRIPVLNSYAQLLAEGYFETRKGTGTFVSSTLPDELVPVDSRSSHAGESPLGNRRISRRSALIPRVENPQWFRGRGPFSVGQLAFDHFPFHVWSSLVARHCRSVRASSLNYGDPMGFEEFREAIAAYLRTARAVRCEASQIMVVSGSQQALEISARALLDPGNRVWIEEPAYPLMRDALRVAGCQLVPVSVDAEGLNVAEGMRRSPKARAAYVTPSHQFPLGVTMSASRRLQLLKWAQSAQSWIVEDDYDSEYRYESMPIASLQGLDHCARVIYIGTFSKTLFPALRLGYLVIPSDLVERFAAVRRVMDIFPPHLYQAALTDFINEGHFSRHIRRTRLLYSERRRALVEAIGREFGSISELVGGEAGMHLVLKLPDWLRDVEISRRAADQQLWLWPLSPCYMGKESQQGFILGFASTPAAEMPRAVARLRSILASA